MPLSCPLPTGHTASYAHESFSATIIVKTFRRRILPFTWFLSLPSVSTSHPNGESAATSHSTEKFSAKGEWLNWELIEESSFENSALEFGGGWNHFYDLSSSPGREKDD